MTEQYSNEYLRGLKNKTDEENRINSIKKFVAIISGNVIENAKKYTFTNYKIILDNISQSAILSNNGESSCYKDVCAIAKNGAKKSATINHNLNNSNNIYLSNGIDKNLLNDNLNDIIIELKKIFPECKIEYKELIRSNDGNYYDLKDIDEKLKSFIINQPIHKFLIIDWS